MRKPEDRELALACLKLAAEAVGANDAVKFAGDFLAFVSGDDATEKLAAVREAIR